MSQQPDPGTAWSDLTDELLGLTNRMKDTYRRVSDESGPSETEVKEAFETLSAAWGQVAGAVGAAVADPEVRTHLRRAAGALADAVTASLSELNPEGRPPSTREEEE